VRLTPSWATSSRSTSRAPGARRSVRIASRKARVVRTALVVTGVATGRDRLALWFIPPPLS